jgi:hypothetical protein
LKLVFSGYFLFPALILVSKGPTAIAVLSKNYLNLNEFNLGRTRNLAPGLQYPHLKCSAHGNANTVHLHQCWTARSGCSIQFLSQAADFQHSLLHHCIFMFINTVLDCSVLTYGMGSIRNCVQDLANYTRLNQPATCLCK